MNRTLSTLTLAFAAITFAFTSSANAQLNSTTSLSNATYDYEIYTASAGGMGVRGYFTVIYRGDRLPEYVGPFDSSFEASYWLFQQVEMGLADDWRYTNVVYTIRPVTNWEYQMTFDTLAQAQAYVEAYQSMSYGQIKIERINAMRFSGRSYGN